MYNEHGALDHVNVTGVNNAALRETLTSDLEELEALRSEIRNMPTRTHIYYVAESLPIPKAGYKEFYNDLYGHIAYPEQSKEAGIEGTVFVKFIVDDNGTIDYITADSNIGADRTELATQLEEEAIKAIRSTSPEWIPARIEGVAVASWSMIPVKFNVEQTQATRLLYY